MRERIAVYCLGVAYLAWLTLIALAAVSAAYLAWSGS